MPDHSVMQTVLAGLVLTLISSAALANSLGECGQIADPVVAQRAACDVATADAAVYANLSMLYLDAGRPHDALAAARRAAQLDPLYAGTQISLVAAFTATGAVDEALAAYHEAQTAGLVDTMALANTLARDLYLAGEEGQELPTTEK
jgi:tetratricopeptide (TPR) repeat protein